MGSRNQTGSSAKRLPKAAPIIADPSPTCPIPCSPAVSRTEHTTPDAVQPTQRRTGRSVTSVSSKPPKINPRIIPCQKWATKIPTHEPRQAPSAIANNKLVTYNDDRRSKLSLATIIVPHLRPVGFNTNNNEGAAAKHKKTGTTALTPTCLWPDHSAVIRGTELLNSRKQAAAV